MRDAVFPEEVSVGDGSERAEPEVTEMLGRRREKDLVHGGAHRLDDFLGDVVEPDHVFLLALVGGRASRPRASLVSSSPPSTLLPPHLYKQSALSPASPGLDPRPASPSFLPLFGIHA